MRTLRHIAPAAFAFFMIAGAASGCGDGGSTASTGSGGAGGNGTGGGGVAGMGGSGGGGACTQGDTKPCYSGPASTEGIGECKAGVSVCTNGQWGGCDGEILPSAAAEVCDGKDEDCNGQVDDGIAQVSCGVGACTTTVEGCVNGSVPACNPLPPPSPVETCDGTDDNCDGSVDEGCDCQNGATQPCYSGNPATKGIGTCKEGVQTCAGGKWGVCENEVLPTAEVCDGLDNDCDTQKDETLGQVSCGAGACAKVVDLCVGGQIQTCTPGTPTPEMCNGIDDDCNLLNDDGLGNTTCGVGACQKTVPACVGGVTQACVPGMPVQEICDGSDNNCNGMTDENNPGGGGVCNTGLPGLCASGTQTCTNGSLVCMQTKMPTAEICNGLDDNCDGTSDDGNPGGGAACSTGQSGVCSAGTLTCMGGSLSCKQNVQPAPTEACDGLDNNCNGNVDEGNPGGGAACSTGLPGVCAAGTQQCQNGMLKCNQTTLSMAETCNGLDDDCNGAVDNGNPGGGAACNTGLLGICAAGTITCTNAALSCKANQMAAAEVCGDGLDNDCNGVVDNGCTGSIKVAVMGGSFYTDTLRTYLATQPQIQSATQINACTLATLQQYNVVVLYGNMSCFDAAAFTSYVQGGGGIVATPWINANYGGFAALPVSAGAGTTSLTSPLNVTVTNAADVLLTGVSFVAGNAVGLEDYTFTLNPGATSSVYWNGNTSKHAVARWSYGTGRSVYLDFHYITSDCSLAINYPWGKQLAYNAVRWAGKLL